MTTFERPPYVLAFCADTQGCGYHRILIPLASLVEPGAVEGRVDMIQCPDHVIAAAKPDVIVWQRQVEDGQIEVMERWRKLLPDTLFVYELDDYLGGIPEASFHSSFMPPNIERQLRRAIACCDRVVTTTEALRSWFQELGASDVRVAANAVPAARIKPHETHANDKLRIGFAGGMSHAGDLELLRPAMLEIGENVTWVFFGTQPEDPAIRVEFHLGVPATHYLDILGQLDLDLMLAPLEDNQFNRCKSNLRLVEAGSVGAAVIAQDMPGYHTDKPPVFAYAKTADDWTQAIWRFIAASKAERQKSGDQLRSWVGRHYALERRLKTWMNAWLPDTEHWRPKPARDGLEHVVIATTDADTHARMPFLAKCRRIYTGLEDACRKALALGAGVLWLRPATTMDETCFKQLQVMLDSAPDLAAVVPLASDGASAFPQLDQWTPIVPSTTAIIAAAVNSAFSGRMLSIPTVSGPVIWLSRNALSMLGLPDVVGCDGNEEQALFEWGLRAKARQWRILQVIDVFAASIAQPMAPTQTAVLRLQARGYAQLLQQPFETLTADERELIEAKLLYAQWGGPRPGAMGFANDYAAWSQLRRAQAQDEIIDFVSDVSVCQFGDMPIANWVVFVDDSIELHDDALKHFQAAISNASPSVYVIYADHDSVTESKSFMPEFKPDFDQELFLAQDYITPICALRYANDVTISDRSDLFKEILYIAHDRGRAAFVHIPRVLGSMALHMTPEALALDTLSRQLAVQDLYADDIAVQASRNMPGCLVVTRKSKQTPKVSIVVPTLGGGRLIQPCVATILQHTAYPNYEILVVQNGDREQPELNADTLANPHVRIVRYSGAFNWARINNWAIREHASGDYIVTLNDDICVATKNWLTDMMAYAVLPDAGAIGAKLLHPMGFYQHIGVVCHRGLAGHMHKGTPNGQPGHLGRAQLTHEVSAVTGACMLFSRDLFDAVDGFDESFAHNYNDTLFCLRLQDLGRRNIAVLSAELLHPEGSSRPTADSKEGLQILIEDSARLTKRLAERNDPYWNPNLALSLMPGNSIAIAGLNAELLAWSDFVPAPGCERVLLINDKPGNQGSALQILGDRDVPLSADLSGFTLKLTTPNAINIRPWNMRDSARLISGLRMLGVDRIVLCSLIGAESAAPPVETLRVLATVSAHIPVTIEPIDINTVAPWLNEDGRVNAADTFGYVDMRAWKEAYDVLEGTVTCLTA